MISKGETGVTAKVADWLRDKNEPLATALDEVAEISDPQQLRTSGYAVHTVQAAFWALEHSKSSSRAR